MINLSKQEKGFTLIELMIVVAIIGILAAIAIPQFSSYRVKAFNSSAQADLRNIMTAEEAAYADTQAYVALSLTSAGPLNLSTVSLPGAKLSKNVKAKVTGVTATDYTAKAKHLNGNKTYTGLASAGITEDTTIAAGTALN